MKKLLSLLLASLMLFGMAFAAEAAPDRESLFQVALLQSLAQGYFDGVITVGGLKARGDTGIGTFDALNGEMIVLDGVVYRAREDGTVEIPPDTETVPYAAVTFLDADETLSLSDVSDMDALRSLLDEAVSARGRNLSAWRSSPATFHLYGCAARPDRKSLTASLPASLPKGRRNMCLKMPAASWSACSARIICAA